jgi:F-type H+-transporting ATPase subunit delta
MENQILAGRYASALFEKASAEKAVDAVQSDLQTLTKLAQESREFHTFLNSPLVQRTDGERALGAILKRINAHAVTGQFLLLLAAKRRLSLLPAISEQLTERVRESRGEITAELETAQTPDAATQRTIADALAKATGKKIHLRLRENPGLLGGLVVYFSGKRLDLSLAGRLDRLSQALRRA